MSLLDGSNGKLIHVRLSTIELTASSYVPPPGIVHRGAMDKRWRHVLDYLRLNCGDLIEFDYSMLFCNTVQNIEDFGDLEANTKCDPARWRRQWGTDSKSKIWGADKDDRLAQGALVHQIDQNSLAKRGCLAQKTYYSRKKMEEAMLYDRVPTRSSGRKAAAEAKDKILGPK